VTLLTRISALRLPQHESACSWRSQHCGLQAPRRNLPSVWGERVWILPFPPSVPSLSTRFTHSPLMPGFRQTTRSALPHL
jgi:hypothetical protein